MQDLEPRDPDHAPVYREAIDLLGGRNQENDAGNLWGTGPVLPAILVGRLGKEQYVNNFLATKIDFNAYPFWDGSVRHAFINLVAGTRFDASLNEAIDSAQIAAGLLVEAHSQTEEFAFRFWKAAPSSELLMEFALKHAYEQ